MNTVLIASLHKQIEDYRQEILLLHKGGVVSKPIKSPLMLATIQELEEKLERSEQARKRLLLKVEKLQDENISLQDIIREAEEHTWLRT